MRNAAALFAGLSLLATLGSAQSVPSAPALAPLDSMYPDLEKLYIDLHQTPELSLHEEKTLGESRGPRPQGARLRGHDRRRRHRRRRDPEEREGPTVLVRADMDALPVEERTGLPYASKVTAKDDAGRDGAVMHACGHDVHMTSLVGAATLLAKAKDRWRGTLFLDRPAGGEAGRRRRIDDAQGRPLHAFPEAGLRHLAPRQGARARGEDSS